MKLLVDEMWPATLAEELRARGHDVVAVLERSDLVHREDGLILDRATSEGRVVFTEKVPDFVPLAAGGGAVTG